MNNSSIVCSVLFALFALSHSYPTFENRPYSYPYNRNNYEPSLSLDLLSTVDDKYDDYPDYYYDDGAYTSDVLDNWQRLYQLLLPYLKNSGDNNYDREEAYYPYDYDDGREEDDAWYDAPVQPREEQYINLKDDTVRYVLDQLMDQEDYRQQQLLMDLTKNNDDDEEVKELEALKRSDNHQPSSSSNYVMPVFPFDSTKKESPTSVPPAEHTSQGQKEVPMLRPAAPVRRPFAAPVVGHVKETQSEGTTTGAPEAQVVQTAAPSGGRKSPTVYDTIKRFITMHDKLRKEEAAKKNAAQKGQPQKRFVSDEQGLVEQLSSLKKSSV